MVTPAGSESVNATPVSATVVLGLVIVKVSDDVALTRIDEGVKRLVISGGDTTPTSSVALAVLPVPPLVEVTAEVLLVLVPAVVPVAVIEKVQVPPAEHYSFIRDNQGHSRQKFLNHVGDSSA